MSLLQAVIEAVRSDVHWHSSHGVNNHLCRLTAAATEKCGESAHNCHNEHSYHLH